MVSIESKGCRHLDEHEPRHAFDLDHPDVDENLEEGPVHPLTNLKLFVSTSMPTRDPVKWTNGSGRRGGVHDAILLHQDVLVRDSTPVRTMLVVMFFEDSSCRFDIGPP